MAETPHRSAAVAADPSPEDDEALDAAILARVETIVRGLQADYLAWSGQELDRLTEALQGAEALAPAARGAAMRVVFTIAHDIKGSGGSFHFDLMSVIGRDLCRFIERRPVFQDADLAVVRLHIETMREVLARQLTGDGGTDGRALLDRLVAVQDIS